MLPGNQPPAEGKAESELAVLSSDDGLSNNTEQSAAPLPLTRMERVDTMSWDTKDHTSPKVEDRSVFEAFFDQFETVVEGDKLHGIIRYRTLQNTSIAAFYLTVVLGGILTYTLSKYTPENDIVTRVAGIWSPCIFFDHWPSNGVSIFGMLIMVMARSLSLWFTTIHTLLTHPGMLAELRAIAFTGPLLVMYLCFVNVFVVSPYELGYTTNPDYSHMNATEYANATAGMTQDEIDGVTPRNWSDMQMHTFWFIVFLWADVAHTYLFYAHLGKIRGSKYVPANTDRWAKEKGIANWVVFILYFVGMISFAMSMMIFLYNDPRGDRLWLRFNSRTAVQHITRIVSKYSQSHLWFFFIMPLSTWAMPKRVGIHFKIKLAEKKQNDWEHNMGSIACGAQGAWKSGEIVGGHLFETAFSCLALVMVVIYSFDNAVNTEASSGTFAAARAFRVKPFSFIISVAWLIMTSVVAWGMLIMCVKQFLVNERDGGGVWRLRAMGAFCSIFLLGMFIAILKVVPTAPEAYAEVGGYTATIAFPFWVIATHFEWGAPTYDTAKVVLYAVMWFVALILAGAQVEHHVGEIILIVLLVSYRFLPDLPGANASGIVVKIWATEFRHLTVATSDTGAATHSVRTSDLRESVAFQDSARTTSAPVRSTSAPVRSTRELV